MILWKAWNQLPKRCVHLTWAGSSAHSLIALFNLCISLCFAFGRIAAQFLRNILCVVVLVPGYSSEKSSSTVADVLPLRFAFAARLVFCRFGGVRARSSSTTA